MRNNGWLSPAGYILAFAATPMASAISVEVRVAASSDDAEESAAGSVALGSTDLELVFDGSNQTVGMRFPGLGIPAGATIVSAYVQFTADEAQSEATALSIQAEASDNAATFSTLARSLSTRPRTSASATWAPPAWNNVGAAGPDQRTPELAAIVQEVVSRGGWSVGNALVVLVTGSGHRTAEAFNGAALSAPLLHVDYEAPGINLSPVATILAPANQSAFDIASPIDFVGSAFDAEDGDLTASLAWSSNIDGAIGVGGSVTSSSLSVGVHTVTASVTDSSNAIGSATLTIEVVSGDPIVVGAGDIADCTATADEATAQLLDALPGTVITLGDNAYEDGTDADFANCYEPTWGRHKVRTRPATGNHDYHVPGAAGYFAYFGAAAGDPATGYYSYNVGAWHVIVLNSECNEVGGCTRSSPQGQWLAADLTANPSLCTLAYWHKPRFSSGFHGSNAAFQPLWELLYEAGADVVLNGHDHDYERFALQDPNGNANPGRGIRQFVAGTGGGSLHPLGPAIPNSETRHNTDYGVLKLTLRPTGYDWRFIPIAGAAFSDSGSDMCVEAVAQNQPPQVAAGPDQSVLISQGAVLDGTVTDDGLPNPPGALTTTWSQVAGPGMASFANPTSVDTTVDFPLGGNYILRLAATDGELIATDDVVVTVGAPGTGSVDLRVVTGLDDVEERVSDGRVSRSSNDLELILDKADQIVGIRFTGLTIPRGATIVDAWVQFQADAATSVATSLTVLAEGADNAPPFTSTARNVSNRTQTNASAVWTPPPWTTLGQAGPAQRTPSLAAVVQEVVNRPGWSSGNALVVIITGSGKRRAESFEGSASGAPLLHVEYVGS